MPRGRKPKVEETVIEAEETEKGTLQKEESVVESENVENAKSDETPKKGESDSKSDAKGEDEKPTDSEEVAKPVSETQKPAKVEAEKDEQKKPEKDTKEEAKPAPKKRGPKPKSERLPKQIIATSPIPLYITPSSQSRTVAISGVITILEATGNWNKVEATIPGLGKVFGYIKK